jgi:predicted nucleic acid-binding protein
VTVRAVFDTSALKWAYLDGTRNCRRCRYIISRARGDAYVAEITVIEIVSALANLVREHRIAAPQFAKANFMFLRDVAERRIVVVPFPTSEFVACRDLLTFVGLHAARSLKTQDAMVAYTARRMAIEENQVVRLFTSDQRLAAVVRDLPVFKGLVKAEYLAP